MRLKFLLGTLALGLICMIPLIGQSAMTVIIVREPRLPLQKVLWIVVVWIVPFFGPIISLVIGTVLCRPLHQEQWGWMIPAAMLLIASLLVIVALGNG